jgi:hypothetical protein
VYGAEETEDLHLAKSLSATTIAAANPIPAWEKVAKQMKIREIIFI